jgi:diguanylate cyclase (GGDEF)-like protein/PAS domain S-box-containing protein
MISKALLRLHQFASVVAFCWLILAFDGDAFGQMQDRHFQGLPESAALSQSTVSAIINDRHGFIWIATQAGLHRFDGRNTLLFQHEPSNPASIPSNFVSALAEDHSGQIWIGTSDSYLAILRPATNTITVLPPHSFEARNRVQTMTATLSGEVFVASAFGIERFPPGSLQPIEVMRFPSAANTPRVGNLLESDGIVYAATPVGAYRFVPPSYTPELIVEGAVWSLVAHHGMLWLGRADGVFQFDGKALRKTWPLSGALPADHLLLDRNYQLWIGSRGHGLSRVLARDDSSTLFKVQPMVRGALPDDYITALHVDHTGLLWVGTGSAGVVHTPTEGHRAKLLRDSSAPVIRGNNVRALAEDAQHRLWVGTEADGLKIYDFATDRFADHTDALRQALGLASRAPLRVLAVVFDGEHQAWVGTGFGLLRQDRQGRWKRIPLKTPEGGTGETVARTLTLDEAGKLWIGTSSDGVYELDRQSLSSKQHTHLSSGVDGLPEGLILCAFRDSSNRLWFGTQRGLGMHEPTLGHWHQFRFEKDNPKSLPSDTVRSIYQDEKLGFWVGTHSGAARIVGSGHDVSFERLDLRPALPSLTVYSVRTLGDRIWFSTNSGLAEFNPNGGLVQRLDLADGLQGLEFNGDVAIKLRNGSLVFGGANGINLLEPEVRLGERRKPSVIVLDLIHGAQREVFAPESLTVPWAERNLSITLGASDYRNPRSNIISWRLHGVDPEVRRAEGFGNANYSTLIPGRYVLEAAASNDFGQSFGPILRYEIAVNAPWWLKRPMLFTYAAVVVLLVTGVSYLAQSRIQADKVHLRETKEREQQLRVSLWGSGDDLWDWHVKTGKLYRRGTENVVGVDQDGSVSEADWLRNALHPDDQPLVRQRIADVLAGVSQEFVSEHRMRGASDWIWVLSRGKVVEWDSEGRPARLAGTARNVTAQRAAQADQRISAEVIRSMSEAVLVLDPSFRVLSTNPAFAQITGFEIADVLGRSLEALESPRHSVEEYRAVARKLHREGRWRGELWLRRKNGADLFVAVDAVRVERPQEGAMYVVVLNDITERKRAELELNYLANFDALTGLPNRAQFQSKLSTMVRRASKRSRSAALLFVDLDRFKQINDTMGHSAGDDLLKAASQRLVALASSKVFVARLGGDEFTLMISELENEADATTLASRIVEAFREAFNLGGNEVVVSPSIGIAFFPQHGEDAQTLLKHADVAMYSAKEAGRNTYRQYDDSIAHLTRQRAILETGLRRALERREFQLVYQPIVALESNRITSAEALLRWRHPELGTIAPDVFVPILEESGMVVQVGSWVLAEAISQLAAWRSAGLKHFRVAINVSMLQLLRGEIEEEVSRNLKAFALPGDAIEIELTESMVMANPEHSIRVLDALAQLGVGIVVDDFGTGYSSLAYLKKLPIGKLKIDKSFIRDLAQDGDGSTIVNIVIALAHVLGLKAVGEGVENQAQLDFLQSNGCDEVQGYLLAKPLTPDELASWARAQMQLAS